MLSKTLSSLMILACVLVLPIVAQTSYPAPAANQTMGTNPAATKPTTAVTKKTVKTETKAEEKHETKVEEKADLAARRHAGEGDAQRRLVEESGERSERAGEQAVRVDEREEPHRREGSAHARPRDARRGDEG